MRYRVEQIHHTTLGLGLQPRMQSGPHAIAEGIVHIFYTVRSIGCPAFQMKRDRTCAQFAATLGSKVSEGCTAAGCPGDPINSQRECTKADSLLV
jgi:hypothetical protein